ncbi:MAG TPA: phosphoribosyltransferase family protein [Candidatus Obscuribacterales bacterium]
MITPIKLMVRALCEESCRVCATKLLSVPRWAQGRKTQTSSLCAPCKPNEPNEHAGAVEFEKRAGAGERKERLRAAALEDEGSDAICGACLSRLRQKHPEVRVLDIDDKHKMVMHCRLPFRGATKKLVYRLKYDSDLLLVDTLSEFLAESIAHLATWYKIENALIVAVPLHWTRYFSRGFNQAELLAKRAARSLDMQMHSRALKRVRRTKTQYKLGKLDRLANVNDAFQANRKIIEGKTIILVDDVCTSGSTLTACARAALSGGAERVFAATLAYASIEDAHRTTSSSPHAVTNSKSALDHV